jgi:predicted alpha/beta-fold hydrolase
VTAKIIGYGCANDIFDECHVSGKDIEGLGTDTLLILSKDDPIVSYSSMPIHHISNNAKIKFIATDRGSHLCWFTGAIPKRWYPTPIFNFINDLLHK